MIINREASAVAGAVHGFASVYFILFFLVLSASRPVLSLGQMSSPDDVILSELQAISQLFRHIPPQESFVKLAN